MSLQIGSYIAFALSEDNSSELYEAVEGRVYPVIVPMDEDPDFPYIVFASNGMQEASTKDGIYGDTVEEEILVFARDLDTLEATAQLVRDAMTSAWSAWNATDGIDFEIEDQSFRAGAEDYDLVHDGYFVTLNYSIETT